VVFCFFLSLLSKEAGICFVIMALIYLFWWNRRRLYPFIGMMVLPIAAWLALKIYAVGFNAHASNAPINQLSLAGRLLTAPSIMLFYVTKFLYPWKLASGYYWVYPRFSLQHILLPLMIDLVVIAFVIYMAFVIRARASMAQYYTYIFFAVWAGIGLLTTLQIVATLDMTACETWIYFSSIGSFGMIGVVLVTFQDFIRLAWFVTLAAIVIVTLCILTVIRGTEWSSAYNL
jgi:hypothetical protein